jgi:hypothetical protein
MKLKEIQETVRAGMDSDTFSKDYKTEALLELEEDRKVKAMGSRSSNTAAHADARATTSSLTDEVCFTHHLLISHSHSLRSLV